MATNPQISVTFPEEHRLELERIAAQTSRSVASLVREAVALMLTKAPTQPAGLTADGLWEILGNPVNWAAFKKLAAEMEAASVFVGDGTGAAPPQPTSWRYRRPEGVAPRPAPVEQDIEPPF